jgi:hypothetical protein
MSNTIHHDPANQTNLSPSRTTDDLPKDVAAIPAVTTGADRRSDGGRELANPSPIAPPARTSRRGFLMNTMVSAASLVTATAITVPPIATAAPAVDAVSFPDLVARFLLLRERWKSDLDSEVNEVCEPLSLVVKTIVNRPPKSLCDLGWQAETFLTWADDYQTIEDYDDEVVRMVKTLLANVRSLAGPMIPSIPVAETDDPIFAAIEAHKAARVALYRSIDLHSTLESELPRDKRRSRIKFFEETICETDDPRWIESERAVIRCHDAEENAAIELLGAPVATRAGILALLQYTNTADIDGAGWPDALVSDDGSKTRSWHYFLIEKLAEDFSNAVG